MLYVGPTRILFVGGCCYVYLTASSFVRCFLLQNTVYYDPKYPDATPIYKYTGTDGLDVYSQILGSTQYGGMVLRD